MNLALITARVLHIFLGVFWAGTMIFNAAFLGPALRDAGPNAGPVMGNLIARRLLDVIPAAAALNLLSGIWLFWHVSSGFSQSFMASSAGRTYGTGAVVALIAFAIGVGVVRPSMRRAAELGKALQTAADTDKQGMMAQLQATRARAGKAGAWVAFLLGGTVVAMAIGRYV